MLKKIMTLVRVEKRKARNIPARLGEAFNEAIAIRIAIAAMTIGILLVAFVRATIPGQPDVTACLIAVVKYAHGLASYWFDRSICM
jgi:hypothetical protein